MMAANEREVGEAAITADDTTFKTTGTDAGLPAAPAEVTVTVPLYWPTASVEPFTWTDTLPGVVPEAGVALSQLAPFCVEAATVKFKATGLPVTAMVCAAGAAPPAAWVNVS